MRSILSALAFAISVFLSALAQQTVAIVPEKKGKRPSTKQKRDILNSTCSGVNNSKTEVPLVS